MSDARLQAVKYSVKSGEWQRQADGSFTRKVDRMALQKDPTLFVTGPVNNGKRIRQSDKPLMNKLEQEWFNILSAQYPNYPRPRAQAKRYRTSRSSWYKPDVTASSWPQYVGAPTETAWEIKGPKQMKNIDRGILSLKVAASQWPEVRFVLCWKESGVWKTQWVMP